MSPLHAQPLTLEWKQENLNNNGKRLKSGPATHFDTTHATHRKTLFERNFLITPNPFLLIHLGIFTIQTFVVVVVVVIYFI